MNPATIHKTLSLGVGSWLQFERCCKRTEVLSEAYISYPICQILNSHTDKRIVSEFRHPVLTEERPTKRGRKPSVDFVACDHSGEVEIAIEVKWLGRSDVSPRSLIWDLVRLELIRRKFGADCFFILAGRMGKIDTFFERNRYSGKYGGPKNRSILKHKSNGINSLALNSSIAAHRSIFRSLYNDYPATKFPNRLATTRATPLITDRKPTDYQVYVWRLAEISDEAWFKPENIPHF